jgi:predicted PurR-regulated permease PerM
LPSENGLPPHLVSIGVIAAAIVLLVVLVPDVVFAVFAGVLLAIMLARAGGFLAVRLKIARGLAIVLVLLAACVVLVAAGASAAPEIGSQFDQLIRRVPAAVATLRTTIEQFPWAQRLMTYLTSEGVLWSGGLMATTAFTTTFGALGTFVVILFVGIYGALQPDVFRNALLALLAPSIRRRGSEVMDAAVGTLANWLTAQLIAMAIIGVLTSAGLWLLGVPLSLILGLIAALLTFVPNVGPILAAVPAILLVLGEGYVMVLWVAGLYIAIQIIEGYAVTPILQQERLSMPPAFIIAVQLLFAALFGLLGLALATPIAALAVTLTRMVYVEDYLEREPQPKPAKPRE